MILQEEIDQARMQVHTDSYPMSIGELANLYDDGELDIHPEFQRMYRWSSEQKSKLIESILLGIPLPSIFVAQRKDGVWDVVDGLQRISTILSFLGKLKNSDGELLDPLKLSSTKYLPSLGGKTWDNDIPENEIDIEIKRVFKREKLDIKIIKRESEGDTKYELFQRLNTGGTKLSDQEVRNCMLLMLSAPSYQWLKDLAINENFVGTTPISEKQTEECYAQELVLRFIVQRHSDGQTRKDHSDVRPYLDAELTRLFSQDSSLDLDIEKDIFEKTFILMNNSLGEDVFKKYNKEKNKYEGAISILIFECLVVGVSKLIESNSKTDEQIIALIQVKSKELIEHKTFIDTLEKRIRPVDRMVVMSELGLELFGEG
ncbi:DUF262 domain-containing protein [Moritella viscosa]|uniref:GmrSD restriction endonucleases N-terminal domain-containing protein n=1 Tax=Moritella viscosa TaxID=80854 RepID=A0ABY1HDR3_9GAMM|nr:DUF262 domain-containing protein [Moritella viscosa]SGY93110.1 Putative uncharacterized protein [Moritella viscosa]SHO26596.1 Putative uncharacterized protein [Moritella viscosa]